MGDLICYDKYGDTLEYFTQWDQDQVVMVSGAMLDPVPVVRFSNRANKTSFVIKATVEDGCIRADLPNIILMSCFPITMYLNYEYEDGSSKTREVINIPVIPCPMPEDYKLTQNIDYVSWTELSNQAKELMAKIEAERIVIEIGKVEPSDSDIVWFDTN